MPPALNLATLHHLASENEQGLMLVQAFHCYPTFIVVVVIVI